MCRTVNIDNQLVRDYDPMVSRIALKQYRRDTSRLDLDDLVQAGRMGLIVGSQRFNKNAVEKPELTVPFDAFIWMPIRSAIIDHVRELLQLKGSDRKALLMTEFDEAYITSVQSDEHHMAEVSEVVQIVELVIKDLPEKYKTIAMLRLENLSWAEIKEQTGIARTSACRWWNHRIVPEILRRCNSELSHEHQWPTF